MPMKRLSKLAALKSCTDAMAEGVPARVGGRGGPRASAVHAVILSRSERAKRGEMPQVAVAIPCCMTNDNKNIW